MLPRIRAREIVRTKWTIAVALIAGLGAWEVAGTTASARTDLASGHRVVASSTRAHRFRAHDAVDVVRGRSAWRVIHGVRVRVHAPIGRDRIHQNLTTRWISGTGAREWIYVDLGSVHSVREVVLHWAKAYARAYAIQVSNDGSNWTTVYSTSNGAGGVSRISGLSASGRYVRMYATERAARRSYALRAFSVYGPAPSVAHSTSATPPSEPLTSPVTNRATWFGTFASGFSQRLYPYSNWVTNHVSTMADPSGTGQRVAKFAINDADVPYNNAPNPRGDIFSPAMFKPGADYYISIPVKIPTGLPLGHNDGKSFFQWAQITYPGNPQPAFGFDIGAHGDNVNHYDMGVPENYAFPWVGPAVDGKWHVAIVHAHFEPNSSGYIQLWWDGVRQTFDNGSDTWYGPTLTPSPDGQYHEGLDIDNYRARGYIPGTVTLYHGAPAIGRSYASVAQTVVGAPAGP